MMICEKFKKGMVNMLTEIKYSNPMITSFEFLLRALDKKEGINCKMQGYISIPFIDLFTWSTLHGSIIFFILFAYLLHFLKSVFKCFSCLTHTS